VDFARDIGVFICEVVGEPAIVGGQSVGAVTTLPLAGTDPDVVLAAIASDPPAYMGEWMTSVRFFAHHRDLASLASRTQIEAGLRRATPEAADALIAARVRRLYESDSDTWAQWADRTIHDGRELDEEIARIKCPLMILHGDRSLGSLLRPGDVRRIERPNPAAQLVHVEGVGHGVAREGAAQFLDAVLPFLDGLAVSASGRGG
jgi:pimeloyl-ACP methyl ester carboxylesterase